MTIIYCDSMREGDLLTNVIIHCRSKEQGARGAHGNNHFKEFARIVVVVLQTCAQERYNNGRLLYHGNSVQCYGIRTEDK